MFRFGLLLGLFAVAGCNGEPEDSGAGAVDATETPQDWSDLVADGSFTATYDAEGVAAGIQEILAMELPNPYPLLLVFTDLMSRGDENCPGSLTSMVSPNVPLEGCTSTTGYTYAGVATLILDDLREYDENGDWTGEYAYHTQTADFTITRPEGTVFAGGGAFFYGNSRPEADSGQWYALVRGTWIDEAGPGWLGSGVSSTFSVYGTRVAEAGHNTMTAAGGVGIGDAALYFKEVNFDESICSGSPVSGVMMYRQPGGGWYAFELAEDCSGCGQVIWNEDTDLGSACVDFKRTTTLLTGMGDP